MTTREFQEAVVVVIRNDFGEVLFGKRAMKDSFPGVWNPVTGQRDLEESLEETCHRETREEVGLTIELGPKVWESTTAGASFVLHWFEARALSSELTLDENEIAEARWVSAMGLRELDLVFRDSLEFFDRYFREQA